MLLQNYRARDGGPLLLGFILDGLEFGCQLLQPRDQAAEGVLVGEFAAVMTLPLDAGH